MYAETGTQLRTELAALLRQHRIQQTLGGPTSRSAATATDAERQAYGRLIRRYRQGILTWCDLSLEAARPAAFTRLPTQPVNPFKSHSTEPTALMELHRALRHTMEASTATPATLRQLTTAQPNETVERWRQAARAAALAEHDVDHGLSTPQALALLGDVAAITQALIVLDQRYANTPGWEALANPHRLGWTALACATQVALGNPDFSVDHTGWRPRTKLLREPAPKGLPGLLHAEHNLLIRLANAPNAVDLRTIVESQWIVSDELSPLAGRIDPRLGEQWAARATAYAHVHSELRNIGGKLGQGRLAVAQASLVVARAEKVRQQQNAEPRVLGALNTVFTRIDARVAEIIDHGLRHGLLLERVLTDELSPDSVGLIKRPKEQYLQAADPARLDDLRTAVANLRTDRAQLEPAGPGISRAALHTALIHRPHWKGGPDESPAI